MDDNLTLLGKRIAHLRNHRGLTQEKFAELLNYSPNHISKLESARTNPSFEILNSISKVLQVEMQDLFDFQEYDKELEYIKDKLHIIIDKTSKQNIELLYKICKTIDLQ